MSFDKAMVVVEYDNENCRCDEFTDYLELSNKLLQLQNGWEYTGLQDKYQLADSFIKNVAMKLGKTDKFGA